MSAVPYHPSVSHQRLSPVFVIGYPGSGSNLTCRLLRRYSHVSFAAESQFILRYYRRLSGYGDLHDDRNLWRSIGALSTDRLLTLYSATAQKVRPHGPRRDRQHA